MDDELLRLLGHHQREDLEGSAELEDAPAPYAGVEREELLDDLFAKLEAEPSGAQAELAPVPSAAEPVPSAAEPVPSAAEPVLSAAEPVPSSKVVELAPRRARQRNLILLGSLSTAAAASLLLWWGMRDPQTEVVVAQLPEYSISRLQGGVAATRGEGKPEASKIVRPDTSIDWVFTPARPVPAALAVAIHAESTSGEELLVAPVEADISSDGAVRIRGRLSEHLVLAPGSWTLRVLLATPAELPETLAELDGPARWQDIEFQIEVRAAE